MKDFSKIKINVAYNQILAYDERGEILYVNSNISEYDVHPWYTADATKIEDQAKKYGIEFPYRMDGINTSQRKRDFLGKLNSNRIELIIDNSQRNFTPRELGEIYQTDENFIYPIILHNNDLFIKYQTLELDSRVVECVRNDRCKIVFIQASEGFFGETNNELKWISDFSKNYGFSKKDVIVITSNLLALDNYNCGVNDGSFNDNVTIRPYAYFQHNLWFAGNGNLNDHEQSALTEKFNGFLMSNKKHMKEYHFLSFNRVIKPHRSAIFGELMTNEKLQGKSILSLGGDPKDPANHYKTVNTMVQDYYRHDKWRLTDFFRAYDSRKHYTYDESDLENNKASSFNDTAHRISFVNIVTESLIGENSIFFSEKTYKPILAAQPFIIFGSPNSLSKLKELGFKTFDKWWDESYDEEVDFTHRLEKIVDVLEEIASWDIEKCHQVINEMESVLRHNFETMINTDDTYKLYSLLASNRTPIKRKIGVCGGDDMLFTESLCDTLKWDRVSYARHGVDNTLIRLQIDEIIKVSPDLVFIGITEPDDRPWEKQKETWIIADGLRKLQEHGIRVFCVNTRRLYEDDLSFAEKSLISDNMSVESWIAYLTGLGIIEYKKEPDPTPIPSPTPSPMIKRLI